MQSRVAVGEANCWWAQQVKQAEGAGRGEEKKEGELAPKCCARGWRNEWWVPQPKPGLTAQVAALPASKAGGKDWPRRGGWVTLLRCEHPPVSASLTPRRPR